MKTNNISCVNSRLLLGSCKLHHFEKSTGEKLMILALIKPFLFIIYIATKKVSAKKPRDATKRVQKRENKKTLKAVNSCI